MNITTTVRKRYSISSLGVIALAIIVSSCTWVELTKQGEKVRVLEAHEVGSCKKLGKTTTSVKDTVIDVERNRDKVKKELESLARNSAADMGGDTVVPVADIENGKQTFDVYRCIGP